MSHLERMYGYFKCWSCKKRWESSHVYCKPGTNEAEYGQECKSCRVMCMPNKVDRLICSRCGLQDCECGKDRHTDLNKPHLDHLCAKCRAGYPCVMKFKRLLRTLWRLIYYLCTHTRARKRYRNGFCSIVIIHRFLHSYTENTYRNMLHVHNFILKKYLRQSKASVSKMFV